MPDKAADIGFRQMGKHSEYRIWKFGLQFVVNSKTVAQITNVTIVVS